MSRQIDQDPTSPERYEMYDYLSEMAVAGELTPPKHGLVSLEQHEEALAGAMAGFKHGKVLFDMR